MIAAADVYSTAKQIDRGNVAQLQVAWTYRTGALPHDEDLDKKAAFEATPILIDGKLFLSTPYDHVIASKRSDREQALGIRSQSSNILTAFRK